LPIEPLKIGWFYREQNMSRSYKKVPIIKNHSRYGKKQANKRVRHIDINSGNNYRKLYESLNIHGHKSNLYAADKIDGIPIYYREREKMTYNEIMEYWRK
jgi:hypothetical protein